MGNKGAKQIIKEIARKTFFIYWCYFFVRYSIAVLGSRQLVIVLTPGHVGSSSLLASLKNASWKKSTLIYGVHSMNEKTTRANLSARHVLQDVLRFFLKRDLLHKKQIQLVTVVRDPIARALGAIFQSQRFIGQFEANLNEGYPSSNNLIEVKKFMLETGYLLETVGYQISFYQNEIAQYYGIHAELKNLDSAGNAFITSKNKSLSILTLENFNRDIPSFFERHHQISPQMEIRNTNATRGGKYSELYVYCKSNLKFERNIVDSIYNDDFIIQLYGQKQIEEFKLKWSE